MMQSLPEDALVFSEDAGFYNPSFSRLIYRTLAGNIDVLSMNEDELQGYLNRRVDLLDAAEIEAALAELHTLIPIPALVVHTRHWALAYGDGVARFARALKAGVTMATTRFCYGDDFTPDHYREIEVLPTSPENAIVVDALNRLPGNSIHCVPVAQVEPPNPTTVGLGDTFVGGFLPALLDL
jgi:ADP-dependent phosphofructokinase/glucokinase